MSEDEAYRIAAQIALGLCASIKAYIGRSGSSRKVVAHFRYGEHCTGIHQHSRRDQWLFRYRVSGLWRRCWGPCAQRVGMAELPFSVPVEIEAEVRIR